MEYIVKQFDIPLLRFSANPDAAEPDIKLLWATEEHKHLLPLDMTVSERGLWHWLKHRTIPKNRAFVHSFLSKCGLSLNRPMNIVAVCKGLSLNDCYWVVEDGFEGTFSDNNLFDNKFSTVLAALAFTGFGSSIRSSLVSSPEFTTNGMLPKCWRRVGGEVMLYKAGTSGASNTGYEPYSEFYAAQIAAKLGIDAVPYNLSKWKGLLCSSCKLFTSKEYSFLPVGRVVTNGGMEAVERFYAQLGEEFTQALHWMFLLDAVIFNTDRHFGNFGFLVDNATNQICAPAPLFDHGNSLFNFAGSDCWEDPVELELYAQTLYPCVYDDFIGMAKSHMGPEQRDALHRLLTFRFERHPTYNLPTKRLRMIEQQVQKRARMLLQ